MDILLPVIYTEVLFQSQSLHLNLNYQQQKKKENILWNYIDIGPALPYKIENHLVASWVIAKRL